MFLISTPPWCSFNSLWHIQGNMPQPASPLDSAGISQPQQSNSQEQSSGADPGSLATWNSCWVLGELSVNCRRGVWKGHSDTLWLQTPGHSMLPFLSLGAEPVQEPNSPSNLAISFPKLPLLSKQRTLTIWLKSKAKQLVRWPLQKCYRVPGLSNAMFKIN